MPEGKARWLWVGRITAAAIIGGLAWYLSHAGLDRADKIASTVGVLVALTALVAPYLLRPVEPTQPTPAPQVVADSTIAGRVVQIRQVKGDVRIRPGLPPTTPAAGLPPAGHSRFAWTGQTIDGARIGGEAIQVDGADGNVDVD